MTVLKKCESSREVTMVSSIWMSFCYISDNLRSGLFSFSGDIFLTELLKNIKTFVQKWQGSLVPEQGTQNQQKLVY